MITQVKLVLQVSMINDHAVKSIVASVCDMCVCVKLVCVLI